MLGSLSHMGMYYTLPIQCLYINIDTCMHTCVYYINILSP